jgi:hypothetical protein
MGTTFPLHQYLVLSDFLQNSSDFHFLGSKYFLILLEYIFFLLLLEGRLCHIFTSLMFISDAVLSILIFSCPGYADQPEYVLQSAAV